MHEDSKEFSSCLDQLPNDVILRTALYLCSKVHPKELLNDDHPLLQRLNPNQKNSFWNKLLELDFQQIVEIFKFYKDVDVSNFQNLKLKNLIQDFITLSPKELYQKFYKSVLEGKDPLYVKLYFAVKRKNMSELKAAINNNDNAIKLILTEAIYFSSGVGAVTLGSPFSLAAEMNDVTILNLFLAVMDEKRNTMSQTEWNNDYYASIRINFYQILRTGNLHNLKILIEKFPDCIDNSNVNHSLFTHAKNNRIEVLFWLIMQYDAMKLPINLPLTQLLENHQGDLAIELIKSSQYIQLANLLHIALKFQHLKLVELLLEKKVDVNKTDDERNTPLHFAARQGLTGLIEKLGTEDTLNAENEDGFTPLHLAAQNGHIETVLVLLAVGARTENILPGQGNIQILDNHAQKFNNPKTNYFMGELIATFKENNEFWDTVTNKKTSAEIIITKIKMIFNAWVKSAEENLPNLISRSSVFQPDPTRTLITQINATMQSWKSLNKNVSPVFTIISNIKKLASSISTEDDKCCFKARAAFLLFHLEKLKSLPNNLEIQQPQSLYETLCL